MVASGEGVWGLGEKDEGIEKFGLVVTEQSRGYEMQPRKYSQ